MPCNTPRLLGDDDWLTQVGRRRPATDEYVFPNRLSPLKDPPETDLSMLLGKIWPMDAREHAFGTTALKLGSGVGIMRCSLRSARPSGERRLNRLAGLRDANTPGQQLRKQHVAEGRQGVDLPFRQQQPIPQGSELSIKTLDLLRLRHGHGRTFEMATLDMAHRRRLVLGDRLEDRHDGLETVVHEPRGEVVRDHLENVLINDRFFSRPPVDIERPDHDMSRSPA